MDITTGLLIFAVIYAVLLFFDNFFKTCAHYPYIRFLEGTGFQIKFLSVTWKTKAFNKTLIRWGNSKQKFLHIWFALGTYCCLMLMPFAIFLLLYSTYKTFIKSSSSSTTATGSDDVISMTPLILGVTVPFSELGYYVLSLLLSSVVHELGHAVAAVLENVNVIEVGANIWLVLPLAFVNISVDKFSSLGCKKSLKILCAGVWHNVVLALVGYLIYQSLPTIFSFSFHVNQGVTVIDVSKTSPLYGSRGIHPGDVITQINNCKITDEMSWYNCLALEEKHRVALCIEDDLIHSLDESVPLQHLDDGNLNCCDSKKKENICFEHLDALHGILELPNYACLPGRTVIEKSSKFCTTPPHVCSRDSHCFRPILSNMTNLFKIICDNKIVIYIGLPGDIYNTVEISPYIPKYYFDTPALPHVITKFMKYLIIFSFGLAIMNVIPCVHLDGQYILETLSYAVFKKKFSKRVMKILTCTVIFSNTCLILVFCLHVLIQKLL